MALDIKPGGHSPLQNKPLLELKPSASLADQLTASKLNTEQHINGLKASLPLMDPDSPMSLKSHSMLEQLEAQSKRLDTYIYEDLVSRNPYLQRGGSTLPTEGKQSNKPKERSTNPSLSAPSNKSSQRLKDTDPNAELLMLSKNQLALKKTGLLETVYTLGPNNPATSKALSMMSAIDKQTATIDDLLPVKMLCQQLDDDAKPDDVKHASFLKWQAMKKQAQGEPITGCFGKV